MCKGTTHTTLRCPDYFNLKIQYLEQEIEVQSRVIKQWKALYESSQLKPAVRECHTNCWIDHSRYNFVDKFKSSQPPPLDAKQLDVKKTENWFITKAARAVDKLQCFYGVP